MRHRAAVKGMSAAASEGEQGKEPSFEQILSRLGEVVEKLERGDLPLDQSLAIFEEGIRLSRLGAERLDGAERRVEELLGDGDPPRTRALASTKRADEDEDR